MKTKLVTILFTGVLMAACSSDDDGDVSLDQNLNDLLNAAPGAKASFVQPASTNFAAIPQDPNNPITVQKVDLGRLLFHETGLATVPKLANAVGTYSCASCHHAPAGFQAGIKQGIGEGGTGFGLAGEGRINDPAWPIDSLDVQPVRTPSALNIAYQQVILWNGQFGAVGPNAGTESQWTVGSPKETNNLGYEGTEIQAIAGMKVHRLDMDESIATSLGYKAMFDQAFPNFTGADRYSRETAGLAIAAYERTLMASESPFQRWLKGESGAMTDSQKEGAMVFFSNGGCVSCHNGPALNSMDFYALSMDDLDGPGVYGTDSDDAESAKRGRGGFTGNAADDYKFKVPQLYNLKDSPFYGHGGNFTSVRQVVDYKNAGVPQNTDVPAGQIAAGFQPLNLTQDEVTALVDFLENGLYDANLNRYVPGTLPSGNCFPNADALSKIDLNCN